MRGASAHGEEPDVRRRRGDQLRRSGKRPAARLAHDPTNVPGGCAAVAGAAAATGKLVDDTFLGGLQPAEAAAPPVVEQLVRTGHSNNCDGACGHLVHVADGKVKLVEGAPWGATTIDGRTVPKAYPPRICLRGVSQLENLYSDDRIKYPYKRVGARGSGQWQRISWDEATTMIADNLQKVQAKTARTRCGSRRTPARWPSSRASSASAFALPA